MFTRQGISFALPKGRLAEKTVELLVREGLTTPGVVDFSSRRLIFDDPEANIRFLIVRNMDVPTYIQNGAADIGVVGKDVLMECEPDLYEFLDLDYGRCRLSVAVPKDNFTGYRHNMRVATSFPKTTKKFFSDKGIYVEIIKLYGSVEIAPYANLADCIVDLVESGETLKKNDLSEFEVITESSARFVGNKSLSRVKHERIQPILDALSK